MRCVTLARAASMIGAVAGLALSSWAVAAQDVKDAAPAAASQEAPELRPGEILIKKTGKTKRVVTVARPAEAQVAAAPATVPATVVMRQPAGDSSDKPGPRSVTIGYTVVGPQDMGMGPREYLPASPFLPSYDYGGYYGYNTCLPSYGYGGYGGGCRTYGGFGYGGGYGGGYGYRSYGSYGGYGYGGGRSSFARPSSAPITYARRAK